MTDAENGEVNLWQDTGSDGEVEDEFIQQSDFLMWMHTEIEKFSRASWPLVFAIFNCVEKMPISINTEPIAK